MVEIERRNRARFLLEPPAVLSRESLHRDDAIEPRVAANIRRFVSLLDSGQYSAKALVTRVVWLTDMKGAYEEVAYLTTVTAIMTA